MTVLWIIVAIFVVIAIAAGAVQLLAALGDKRISEQVGNDEERLHTHPRDPGNPSAPNSPNSPNSPNGGRS